jgi:hypothetical protein
MMSVMDELRAIDLDDLAGRAEAALCAAGSVVRLGDVQLVSNEHRRNIIARARATHDDDRMRSIIIKATRSPHYDPAAEDALETLGLVREWAATAYLAARVPGRGHGSPLLAGDVARGLLVFEDLGADLPSLVDPLLKGTAQEAEHALTLYARALGRLHADTAACRDAHRETFESIFGAGRPRRPSGWRVEKDAEYIVSKLGGAPPASELESLSARLADPGPWQSLIHGDPCPDNALMVDGRIRLIDYEFARASHALLDGVYWRIGFPSCWCAGRIPDDVASRVDAVYRAEIAKAMPLARDDDTYRVELAHAAAIWLFTCLHWRLDGALNDNSKWGIWSIRGRLLWYLDFIAGTTARAGVLPGIGDTARGWLAELQRRWPDEAPLGLYPAFAANPG